MGMTAGAMGITDGTGKVMGIKPGWACEREWESVGNRRDWDWKSIPLI